MIIVAAIGLGVNFVGMRILGSNGHFHGSQVDNDHVSITKKHEEESLIVKSAYSEFLNEALGRREPD